MRGTSWLSPKKKRTGWQRNVRTITNLKRKDMEKRYENLRQKTVFDFCDDPKILAEVFSGNDDDGHVDYIMEYSDSIKKDCLKLPQEQARSFAYFAEITKNEELQKAIKKEFKKELEEYYASFNE